MMEFEDIESDSLYRNVELGYIPRYAVKIDNKGMMKLKDALMVALTPDNTMRAIMYTSDLKINVTLEFNNMTEADVQIYTKKFNRWLIKNRIMYDHQQNCFERVFGTKQELINMKESFKRLGTVLK